MHTEFENYVYVTLSVTQKECGYVPGSGFFTCGLICNQEFEKIKDYFNNKDEAEIFINKYAQHETIKLVNVTTDPSKIKILVETFGKLYYVADNLISLILQIYHDVDDE